MMTAYNSINGTPALLHPFVNEIVKGEWGMDGFIVSDAGDVMGIKNDHKYYDSHTPGTVESVKAESTALPMMRICPSKHCAKGWNKER